MAKRICQCCQEPLKESYKIFVDLITATWYGQKETNLSHAPNILCIKTLFLGLEWWNKPSHLSRMSWDVRSVMGHARGSYCWGNWLHSCLHLLHVYSMIRKYDPLSSPLFGLCKSNQMQWNAFWTVKCTCYISAVNGEMPFWNLCGVPGQGILGHLSVPSHHSSL